MNSESDLGYLRLSLVRGIGPKTGRELITTCGSIDALWSMSHRELLQLDGIGTKLAEALAESDSRQAESVLNHCQQNGIDICTIADDNYPETLAYCDDAPLILFTRGDQSTLNHPRKLAVVGARKAGRESRVIARRWSAYCSRCGVAIVSGMAYGVDAAAHGGALEGDSPTIAVLGCGLSMLSEAQVAQADAVADQGCVVSEFMPQVAARPENFPQRNRIIAGLARATLVIEAGLRSGSIITAGRALTYGREVMAVPGSVLNDAHAGCHQLIRDGALLIDSATEIFRSLGWPEGESAEAAEYIPASAEEAKIVTALGTEILHLDQLAEACNLTVPELSPSLLALELHGVIERLPGSRFVIGGRIHERSGRGGVTGESENH